MNFMSPTIHIGQQPHILAYNGVGDQLECHQHTFLSQISKCDHHYGVTNIPMSPTSQSITA